MRLLAGLLVLPALLLLTAIPPVLGLLLGGGPGLFLGCLADAVAWWWLIWPPPRLPPSLS